MFAEILIPQKVGSRPTLTYSVPSELESKVHQGQIVEISLRNKIIKGVIFEIHKKTPVFATKPILRIVEKTAHLQPWQIELAQYIAEYYFCPLFKVIKLFLPHAVIKKKKVFNFVAQDFSGPTNENNFTLSAEQQNALDNIVKDKKRTTLIHGITGSGKTEIYRRLTEKMLEQKKQSLILVPEISLTPQTIQSFQEKFGSPIAVLHSQLTHKQKEKYWFDIFHGQAKVIIGSRSALFAPFQNLGLIMIDEEHESSYKQDQNPRYDARHVAGKIAELLKIKVILGSATPSIESYYLAKSGEYQLVELQNRVSPNQQSRLPHIHIVDLRQELRNKNYSIFSELLHKKIEQAHGRNGQAILFLNKRGAASAVICRECGFIVKCKNCEVAMTYHKQFHVEGLNMPAERLICHHCGTIAKVPTLCPNCQSHYIRYIGLGTQKIEDELVKIFPDIKTLRADRDTIKKRESFENIYRDFKSHQADVLIGTQMIAKGLHFPNVNLVGVILAESGLTLPDFRSTERTFQLLTQVAGRSGREGKNGEVVIQTYIPENIAIQKAKNHDYHGFYQAEIAIRQKFNYPPFSRLMKITFSAFKHETAYKKATRMLEELEKIQNNLPEKDRNQLAIYPAFITRLKKKFRWNLLITGKNPNQLFSQYLEKNLKIQEDSDIRIEVDAASTL